MAIKEQNNIFEDISIQALAVSLLKSAIEKKHIAPAYFFTGPKGVGQKEIAISFLENLTKLYSGKMNIRERIESLNHPDLFWVEPTYLIQGKAISASTARKENLAKNTAPQIRIDQIKEVRNFLGKKPLEGKLGMVVIEEVEKMNESAANALLKTLEEPSNGVLILISDKPERIMETIHSRCQKIPFKPFNKQSMSKLLTDHLNTNTPKLSFEKFNEQLINLSNGSPELLAENLKAIDKIPEDLLRLF